MSKKPSIKELQASILKLENQVKILESELKKRSEVSEPEQEKFYKAFHSNPALMAISTFHDTKYIDVNDAFLKKLGYTREEIIGHTSAELQLYVDIIQSDKFFRKLQKLSKVHDFEVTIKTKTGENRTGLFSAETIMLQGEPCLLTTINDITELKQNKEKLQQIEQRFREFAELLPGMICEADMNGNISFANSYALENFQYSQEDLKKGVNFDQLLIPRDAKRTRVNLMRRIKGHKLSASEVTAIRKDGTTFPAMAYIQPFFEQDKPVGFRGVMIDITERKKAEEEIQRKKAFLEQLIEGAPEAIVQCDTKGNLEKINDEFIKLFGYSRKETLGRNIDELVSSEDQRKEAVGITKEVSGGKKVAIETLRQHKNGTPVYVSILSTPIIVNKKQVGIYAIYRDITERKRAEQDFIIAKQKAEEAAKAKQQFLSTMSHEIRTPLNSVLGMTHLLIQADPRSDQMEYLNALKFSGENLLVLINDILDFSKIESGMVFFEQADFNIKEIINGIKQSFLFRTEEKGITFDTNVDPELPDSIVGDPIRLNQVLTNLIGNAVKFTEKGSITVDLNLKQKTTENVEIEFSVTDTGIGIPKDKLANIFESFKQAGTDITRKYGGTGLGLAITKKLIELQNSAIFVESRVGKGSKFYFSLNFPKSKIKPEHKPVEIKESYKQLEGSNILVAEDNEINFIIAKKLLEKWGAKVDHAENGNVTIDKIMKKDYDVVLMDLHMPELNGYEASEIIRTSENVKNKNIPIIALTASVMPDIQQKIERIGITDYILKPFNPKELYQKVLKKIKGL